MFYMKKMLSGGQEQLIFVTALSLWTMTLLGLTLHLKPGNTHRSAGCPAQAPLRLMPCLSLDTAEGICVVKNEFWGPWMSVGAQGAHLPPSHIPQSQVNTRSNTTC
jgi:hypothetical protein